MPYDLQHALGAWYPLLAQEFEQPYMQHIGRVLGTAQVYGKSNLTLEPGTDNIFRALRLCPPEKVRVVIIGQDPYPGGQADGLAFSSGDGTLPYSLQIIFNELTNSRLGTRTKISLEDWAEQGVLLLNVHLTTLKGHVNAHSEIGWDDFTGRILGYCATRPGTIFLVWGNPAKISFNRYVARHNSDIHVLFHTHPAAHRHGYPFIGCGHFAEANRLLESMGKAPIDWAGPGAVPHKPTAIEQAADRAIDDLPF